MPLIKGYELGQQGSRQPVRQQPQQEDSNSDRILRGLSQLGQGTAEGVAGLAGLPGTIDEYLSGKTILPTSQSLRGHVQTGAKKLLPEKYLEPQSTEDRFLRNVGSSLPGAGIALATGGAALPVAIATGGGAAGETAAQELGLGPLGQFAGSLLGSASFSKGFHALQSKYGIKPQNLLTTATTAQKKLYDKELELGTHINASARSYRSKLLKLEDRINNSSALTSTHKSELKDKLQLALKDIKKGVINGSELVNRKKENNAFYKHLAGYKNKEAREYLDQIQKSIFEEGEQIGKNHPEWLSAWTDADDITKAIKYGEGLQAVAEDAPGIMKLASHPLAKIAVSAGGLGTGLYTGHTAEALGVGASLYAGHKAYEHGKYLAKFLEKPATQRILHDAFKYTANRQFPQLAKALTKLNGDAESYAKKNPSVEREIRSAESGGKGGLVKGRKI